MPQPKTWNLKPETAKWTCRDCGPFTDAEDAPVCPICHADLASGKLAPALTKSQIREHAFPGMFKPFSRRPPSAWSLAANALLYQKARVLPA